MQTDHPADLPFPIPVPPNNDKSFRRGDMVVFLVEKLKSRSFIRVHKSYIVSIDKIEGIERNEIFMQSHRIPISRNCRDEVLQQVIKNKLWI